MKLLINHIAPSVPSFIQKCEKYDVAITTLNDIYIKPKKNRYLFGSKIREKLLENSTVTLEKAYNQALSLEMAETNSQRFETPTHNLTNPNTSEKSQLLSPSPLVSSQQKPIWRFGEVAKILGQLHYIILLDDGFNIKRHINQIRRTEVQKKQKKRVSFSEDVPKHDPTSYFDVPPELMMMVPYTPDRVGNQDVIVDPEEQPAVENEEIPAEVRRSERPRRQTTYLSDYVQ
ncbi:hypothetical protein ILUMI_00595 [Ignelater luminosus]|uniref:Uncharacterized protein n=1 Tax=Ignelater luminosus TaxID=2038154 RepID=A0A8K0GMZ4_IGNLU|nr:hypothetical protein ILUMI_00595 [Ignelater luminosus]